MESRRGYRIPRSGASRTSRVPRRRLLFLLSVSLQPLQWAHTHGHTRPHGLQRPAPIGHVRTRTTCTSHHCSTRHRPGTSLSSSKGAPITSPRVAHTRPLRLSYTGAQQLRSRCRHLTRAGADTRLSFLTTHTYTHTHTHTHACTHGGMPLGQRVDAPSPPPHTHRSHTHTHTHTHTHDATAAEWPGATPLSPQANVAHPMSNPRARIVQRGGGTPITA